MRYFKESSFEINKSKEKIWVEKEEEPQLVLAVKQNIEIYEILDYKGLDPEVTKLAMNK